MKELFGRLDIAIYSTVHDFRPTGTTERGAVALAMASGMSRLRSFFPPQVVGVVVIVTGMALVGSSVRNALGLDAEYRVEPGSALARHVLDYAAAQGLKVDPQCPFIKAWIDRHPAYQAQSLAHGASA